MLGAHRSVCATPISFGRQLESSQPNGLTFFFFFPPFFPVFFYVQPHKLMAARTPRREAPTQLRTKEIFS